MKTLTGSLIAVSLIFTLFGVDTQAQAGAAKPEYEKKEAAAPSLTATYGGFSKRHLGRGDGRLADYTLEKQDLNNACGGFAAGKTAEIDFALGAPAAQEYTFRVN